MCDSSLYAPNYVYPTVTAYNAGQCQQANGRPNYDPATGLCVDAYGHTGGEQRPVVPVAKRHARPMVSRTLSTWKWTSDAAQNCCGYVRDPYGYGQHVSSFLPKRGCSRPGIQACVDGTCVPGSGRQKQLPVPDGGCMFPSF